VRWKIGRLDFFKLRKLRRLDFLVASGTARSRKGGGWIFFAPNKTTARWKIRRPDFFATNRTAKIQERRRLAFFAASRTANIKKRRRSDFLSADHNETLERLNLFEASQKVNCRRVCRLRKAVKGRCAQKELLAKRYTLIKAHKATMREREELCLCYWRCCKHLEMMCLAAFQECPDSLQT
jgi:hypothetical protein